MDDDRFFARDFSAMTLEEVRRFNLRRSREFFDRVDLQHNARIVEAAVGLARSHCRDLPVVVDFGCGNAHFSAALLEELRPRLLLGVELLPLADPRSLHGFLLTDGRSLGIRTGSVSAIVSFFVFHFPLPRSMLAELARVLVPGGSLIANQHDAFGRRQLQALSDHGLVEIGTREVRRKGLTDTVRCLRKV